MPTINATIVTGADDGFMTTSAGATVSSSYAGTQMAVGSVSAGALKVFGAFRFQNINIPASSTINSATLTFKKSGGTNSLTIKAYGNDIDDAPAWGGGNKVKNIAKTTASTNVNIVSATSANTVTAIVAEIVARGGWVSGNDLAFGLFPSAGTNGGINSWKAYAYESGASTWPLLDITYTAPVAGNNQILMS